MTTAESHLLEILNTIFKSNSITDEKNWFKKWIKQWIAGKNSVHQVFNNNNNNDNNNNNNNNVEISRSLQLAHTDFMVRYSQCFFTYNYQFITDLLLYMSTVYFNLFNQNSRELKECINLLKKIKQNMFYESAKVDNVTDIYPKIQYYNNKFENYGRAFIKYYNYKRVPFVIHVLLHDTEFHAKDNNQLKFYFYNFIDILLSNNDKEWLEFLHGRLLDTNFAEYQHRQFCNKYQNNIWSYDIQCLLKDFENYLTQISDVIFHKKYLKNKSLVKDICFPAISKFDNDCVDGNIYNDYYYDKNIEDFKCVTKMNSIKCYDEEYNYILQKILPYMKTKFENKDENSTKEKEKEEEEEGKKERENEDENNVAFCNI